MHGPIDLSLPLPLLIVGEVRHFHAFVEAFSYLPRTSDLPLVDYYVLGNNGEAYSDHAIVYSPSYLGRNLEHTHDDQLWAFTVMLDQINQKYKTEHQKDISCQEFIDEYATVFVRDRFLTSRKIHVTPAVVYEHWISHRQKQVLNDAIDTPQKVSVRKI